MKKVKIAAVGSNGHQIIGLIPSTPAAELAGIAEFGPAEIAALEKSHPALMASTPRFERVEDLLQKTDCDLVSLCCARRDQQAGRILACLAAGRHVLAEKPLCASLDALEAIRSAARSANRKVWAMIGMVYSPIFQEFQRRIRAGELGEVGQVFAQKSYKTFTGRPQDRGIDGGIIQAAIHAISYVRSTTGLEFAEVSAMESAVGNALAGDLQIEFGINARLSNGALCQITANYLNPKSAPFWGNDHLRVFGTRGMLEAVDGLTRTAFYREDGIERRELELANPNYLSDLLNEIASNQPAILTMEDSLRCTQIALECQASATAGGAVRRLSFPV